VVVPLRSLVDPSRLRIGTAYNDARVWDEGDPAGQFRYEKVLADHFSVVTAENACKPSAIMRNASGPPDFVACDRVLAFAKANDMAFRLHVLSWGDWNPKWMKELPATERRAALLAYTRTVLEHYAGQVDYVDVVNEAVCDEVVFTSAKQNCGSGPGQLKSGQWVPAVSDYLGETFRLARELCPSCKLVYNDYGFESDADIVDPRKYERVLATVGEAKRAGVPIDAVGFQFHISTQYSGNGMVGMAFRGYLAGVSRVFTQFAALGVELHVTEIDVGCSPPTIPCPWETMAWRDAQQAEVYAGVLRVCLQNVACTIYQSWGFTDRYSWRDSGGVNQTAHAFDRNLAPKLAYWAMVDTLRMHAIASA